MKISKTFTFEASHQLPKHPGKCARLHGHSWVLTVSVHGRIVPETGMLMDYADLKAAVTPLVQSLDHQHLGNGHVLVSGPDGLRARKHLPSTVPGLTLENPTSEELLWWIADHIPLGLQWAILHLKETCTSDAELTYQEWARERRTHRASVESTQETPSAEAQERSASSQDGTRTGRKEDPEALALITAEDIPF